MQAAQVYDGATLEVTAPSDMAGGYEFMAKAGDGSQYTVRVVRSSGRIRGGCMDCILANSTICRLLTFLSSRKEESRKGKSLKPSLLDKCQPERTAFPMANGETVYALALPPALLLIVAWAYGCLPFFSARY